MNEHRFDVIIPTHDNAVGYTASFPLLRDFNSFSPLFLFFSSVFLLPFLFFLVDIKLDTF